jgi:heme iron utilization protein
MTEPQEPVALLQTVDDTVRRRVRSMVRSGRFAALASLEPETGAPMVSRIGLVTDVAGAPVFLTSTLTAHTAAIQADPRCSILIGEPGKGDPLAHARVSIVGRAEQVVPGPDRDQVRFRYLSRHPKAELYADFGDFSFWRVRVERASFNGGFGKAYQMSAADLILGDVDLAGVFAAAQSDVVGHMNDDHADAVGLYATALCGAAPGPWRLAGIDPEGLDLALGDDVLRLWFEAPIADPGAIRPVLVSLARQARQVGAN